jgi:hypothetical protein
MATEHSARITWSAEQVRRGLPPVSQTIDPAWLEDAEPLKGDGWTLMCRFERPPVQQGNPSAARVRFLVDEAPHDQLKPGTSLRLFERGTKGLATVEILD